MPPLRLTFSQSMLSLFVCACSSVSSSDLSAKRQHNRTRAGAPQHIIAAAEQRQRAAFGAAARRTEGGRVDHHRPEEGVEKVVATVVVVSDLVRGRRDRLEGGGGEGEELLKQEADQTPVGTPVDKLIAVVDESLIAVLLEGDIVVQELLHQDVHRDLSLAPLLLERIVL